jgi:AcrR family transcriptional regulator
LAIIAAKRAAGSPATRPERLAEAAAKQSKASRGNASATLLLEATSHLLATRNVVDVSLSEIAQASGLNSALIKYHFGSKDGLLLALVKRDATNSLHRLDHLLRMNISPEQKVRLHVAGIINTYVRYPYLNRLIHLLLTNSEEQIAAQIANFFVKPLVEAQSKILDEGVRQGMFRRVEPMFFYYSIIGACDHVFFARYSLKFAFGVTEFTSRLRDNYIEYVSDMAVGMLLEA